MANWWIKLWKTLLFLFMLSCGRLNLESPCVDPKRSPSQFLIYYPHSAGKIKEREENVHFPTKQRLSHTHTCKSTYTKVSGKASMQHECTLLIKSRPSIVFTCTSRQSFSSSTSLWRDVQLCCLLVLSWLIFSSNTSIIDLRWVYPSSSIFMMWVLCSEWWWSNPAIRFLKNSSERFCIQGNTIRTKPITSHCWSQQISYFLLFQVTNSLL